ncbi:MAG: tetratricopeptide repeat protein [Blastocatellia bacterium]|nr:tetratricopeptide repeat protein [Blastocatellia bacterium]
MDPFSFSSYFTASAIWTGITTVAGTIAGEVAGGRTDSALVLSYEKIRANLSQYHPDSNYDLEQAIYRAYLQACLQTMIFHYGQMGYDTAGLVRWEVLPNWATDVVRRLRVHPNLGKTSEAARQWLEAALLRVTEMLAHSEEPDFVTKLNTEPELAAMRERYVLLLRPPEGEGQLPNLRESLIEKVLADLEQLKPDLPEGLAAVIRTHWFDLFCGCFQTIFKRDGKVQAIVLGKLVAGLSLQSDKEQLKPFDGAAVSESLLAGLQTELRELLNEQTFIVTQKLTETETRLADKFDLGIQKLKEHIQPTFNPIHQLPAASELIGRDNEIKELLAQIEHSSITISASVQGQGGVGKTALALVLANRLKAKYSDAQFFLDLQGVTNPLTPAQAMAHVIRSYDLEAKLPDDEALLTAKYRSVLHEKKALLLWDNARDKAQIEPLQPPEGCVMIVTSRQQFALPWLHTKALKVLPRDQSIALLCKLAARIGEIADRIAELCGDLPFALTLAASAIAETPNLTVARYVERLVAQRLQTLDGIAASLRLSYELLSEAQKERWRVLSVFPATFDEAATAAVWDIEADDACDVLSELIKFSLVEFDDQKQRYHLHDLAREFARECLNDTERALFSLRHATHYCAVLGKAGKLYRQGHSAVTQGLNIYDQEDENILLGQRWAALHRKQSRQAAQLCIDYANSGAFVIQLRLHPRKRILWLTAALAAAKHLHARSDEGFLLNNLGISYKENSEFLNAIDCYEQRLVLAREDGDLKGEGKTLANLGSIYLMSGEPEKAISYYEPRLAIARQVADYRGEGIALCNLGNAYRELDEYDSAIKFYAEGLRVFQEIGDLRGENQAMGNLGSTYFLLGHPDKSIEFYDQTIPVFQTLGDLNGEATAWWNRSLSLDKLGNREEALANAEIALKIYLETEAPNAEKVRRKLAEWRNEE